MAFASIHLKRSRLIDCQGYFAKSPRSSRNLIPYACLARFDDWWEHDGLHFSKGNIGISDLFDLVHSPKSLLESTPADDMVFVGIGSADGAWYLRYRAGWDDTETNIVGRLAFVLSEHLGGRFRMTGLPALEQSLREIGSDVFYKETIE